MSFNPDVHNVAYVNIDRIESELSVWINDHKKFGLNKTIAAIFTMREGNFRLHINMNEADANALINGLHQHITNIKAAEVEMIAQSAEVAA